MKPASYHKTAGSNNFPKRKRLLLLSLLMASMQTALADGNNNQQDINKDMDNLIVTAQKREGTVKDIPVSIDVLTNKDITTRHLTRTRDVMNQAVNVDMGTISGNDFYDPFMQIRGVGSNIIAIDPSVGLFVDDTPVTNSQAYSFDLLDVTRAEILRGPQGTLYGRNTLAGAVNIITNKPVFGETSFEAGTETGSHGKTRGQSVINTRLNENLALRLAVAGMTSRGTATNTAPNAPRTDKISGGQLRLSLRGYIGDNMEVLTVYEHSQQNPRDIGYIYDKDFLHKQRNVNISNPGHSKAITHILRNYFTWHFTSGGKLVSTTSLSKNHFVMSGSSFPDGYFDAQNAFITDSASQLAPSLARGILAQSPELADLVNPDSASFPLNNFRARVDNPYNSNFKLLVQEFRYESPSDTPIKWLAGVYGEYSDSFRDYGATNSYEPSSLILPGQPPVPLLQGYSTTAASKANTQTTSLALFGDTSYTVTSQFEVFGGLRLGYDNKRFNYSNGTYGDDQQFWQGINNPGGSLLIPAWRGSLSATYVMPGLGVRYQFTENSQSYASISRGFKTGGFNDAFIQPGTSVSYGNENLMSYETGVKSALMENHLNLNAAVFYIDRHNQQVQFVEPASQLFWIANAPKSRSYGGELTLNTRLDEHWSGYAGIGYTDATYRDYASASGGDASGKQQQYISKVTGNIGMAYTWNTGINNVKGRADIGYQYRSGFCFDPINSQKQSGYGLLNARLAIGNKHYQVYAWGQNLTNQYYRTSLFNLGYGEIVTRGQLRSFGAGISARL